MGKKCTLKVEYDNYEEALSNANRYMSDIPLTFTNMVPYYCQKHSCYHVGHDREKREYIINLLQPEVNAISYSRGASDD